MKFLNLELQNVCQHRLLALEFSPGLNALVGANGAGKSNIMKMLRAAIIGDYKTNAGVKTDNIRHGTAPGESSRIVTTVTHENVTLEIVRGLQRAQTQVRINNDKPVYGDKAVNEAILDALAIKPKILSEHVFVMQGDIFRGIVDARSAERAKMLQALFDLSGAERCWAAVGQRLQQIEIPDVSVSLDLSRSEVKRVEAELQDVETLLAISGDLADYREDIDPDKQVITQYEHWRDAVAQRDSQLEAQRRAVAARDAALDEVNKTTAQVEALKKLYQEQGDAAQVREMLQEWQRYNSADALRRKYESEQRILAAEAKQHPEPLRPDDYVEDVNALQGHITTLSRDLTDTVEFLRLFRDEHYSLCPTCAQRVSPSSEDLAAKAQHVAVIRKQLPLLREQLQHTSSYAKQHHNWQVWRADFDARVTANNDNLLALTTIEPPSQSEAELRATLQQINSLATQLTAAQTAVQDAELSLARHQGQLDALEVNIARLEQRVTDLYVAQDAYQAAVASFATTQERYRQRQDQLVRQRLTTQVKQNAIAKLRAVEQQARDAQALIAWRALLRELRDVFHRDALPRVTSQVYLATLCSDINELLALFEAPFQVDVHDGLTFVASFATGSVQDVARLSGGQKVLFGLSFRVAVNALFGQNVSLLCLDEPTEYLDSHNVGCLAPALSHLRQRASQTDLQCIIGTHEETLEPLFDRVHIVSS